MQECIKKAHKTSEFHLFPIVRQNGQYVHESLPFQIVKITESSSTIRPSPPFYDQYFGNCGTYPICAWDWGSLMKIILTPAQYAVVAQDVHACVTRALQNFDTATPVTFEQLSGTGQYVQPRQQAQLPIIVREQCTDVV